MKKSCIFLFIVSQFFSILHATQDAALLGTGKPQGFMTSRDLMKGMHSGITLKNVSTSNVNLTGIYIQTLYSTSGPEGNNYGAAVGALWSNVALNAAATTPVGANFLYNMIIGWLYQNNISTGGGDVITPGATAGTHWLVFLGVIKGITVTPTTNIYSPTVGLGNDLVYIAQPPETTSYSQQICVTCNDSTQTCVLGATGTCYQSNSTSSAVQDVPCNLDSSTNCEAGIYPPP